MQDDLPLARRAALAGAAVALRYFAAVAQLPRELKSDGTVVTEADRAVEAAIRDVLTAARPGDAILGEEAGQTGSGHRRWIVDPIDGTALFVDGDDRWLVLVALEEDAEVVVGVAVVPAQGRIWYARRGGGAFEANVEGIYERRIRVNQDGPETLPGSRLAVVPVLDSVSLDVREQVNRLAAVAPVKPWRLHPALLVATGHLDLALQLGGQVWDYAAPSLIVQEAGGHFGPIDGESLKVGGPAIYARSAALYGAARHVLHPRHAPDSPST